MSKAFQFPLKYVFQYIEKGKEESDLPGHSASEFSGHVTKSNNNIIFFHEDRSWTPIRVGI